MVLLKPALANGRRSGGLQRACPYSLRWTPWLLLPLLLFGAAGCFGAEARLTVLDSLATSFAASIQFADPQEQGSAGAAAGSKRLLVAIPRGAQPAISIQSIEWAPGDTLLTDAPVKSNGLPEPVRIVSRARIRDLDVVVLEVSSAAGRSDRTAASRITRVDFVVDFRTGPFRITPRTRARLSRPRRAGQGLAPSPGQDSFARVFQRVLANPDQAQAFRYKISRKPEADSREAAFTASGCSDCYKITVAEDGIYRIQAASLEAAGFPTGSVASAMLVMYRRGEEVPILVEDGGDGVIDPPDSIVFLGEKNLGRWTDTSCYWLKASGGPGRRMEREALDPAQWTGLQEVGAFARTIRLEENLLHWRERPGTADEDSWFWRYQATNGAPTSQDSIVDYPDGGFDEARLAPEDPSRSYFLKAHLLNKSAANIVEESIVDLLINNNYVGRATWSTLVEYDKELTFRIQPRWLQPTGNTITLTVPKHTEQPWTNTRAIYVDWFEIDVPCYLIAQQGRLYFEGDYAEGALFHAGGFDSPRVEVYRAGSAGVSRIEGYRAQTIAPGLPYTIVFPTPQREEGAAGSDRFFVYENGALLSPIEVAKDEASFLRTASENAQYVVIAHEKFLAEAEAFASYRAAQRTAVAVSLTDVYDEFSHGEVDSRAIRDFLQYAYDTWQTPPEYVLLIGDTSFDYKNFRGYDQPGYEEPSYLPSMEFKLRSIQDRTAISDAWFGCVSGDDFLPDILIGRITSRSAGEAGAVLTKITEYESLPIQPWMYSIQLVADDDINDCGVPGPLAGYYEDLLTEYQPNVDVLRRYLGDYPDEVSVRNAIIDDLNAGTSLNMYFGHGSSIGYGRHCVNSVDDVLGRRELGAIANPGRFTLGVAGTCNVGEFDVAQLFYEGLPNQEFVTDSMAEQYVKSAGKGMIAYIATTTELLLSLGVNLTGSVFETLFDGQREQLPTVGEISLEAAIRHYMDYVTNPGKDVEDARDGVLSLVSIGDPATTVRVEQR